MQIAVIPARGGSKRIPRKNIKDFCGRPMIAWAIEAAINSSLFDKVLVSTDDPEIAEISAHCGAEIPFIRPDYLSDDTTPTAPVVAHAIEACDTPNRTITTACCIYACNPFLRTSDLVKTLEILKSTKSNFIYPVVQFSHPIQRSMRRRPSGAMEFLNPEHELTRTQDLEATYHDAGQFYWGTSTAWLSHQRMHTAGIGFPIPGWRVVDIDSHEDWRRAELIHAALFGGDQFDHDTSI